MKRVVSAQEPVAPNNLEADREHFYNRTVEILKYMSQASEDILANLGEDLRDQCDAILGLGRTGLDLDNAYYAWCDADWKLKNKGD